MLDREKHPAEAAGLGALFSTVAETPVQIRAREQSQVAGPTQPGCLTQES